ncbi:MAG: hypothetical protein IPO58_11540 [Betaproteobacteria bacterium]|nr:hypothetical protein [Betaproteobacteria bacterium]MBK9607001.1 hypothetical protein [Betaproteobacteria bacterium]
MNRTRILELLTQSKPGLFGCAIDLVTEKALRTELRQHIEKEAVRV